MNYEISTLTIKIFFEHLANTAGCKICVEEWAKCDKGCQ